MRVWLCDLWLTSMASCWAAPPVSKINFYIFLEPQREFLQLINVLLSDFEVWLHHFTEHILLFFLQLLSEVLHPVEGDEGFYWYFFSSFFSNVCSWDVLCSSFCADIVVEQACGNIPRPPWLFSCFRHWVLSCWALSQSARSSPPRLAGGPSTSRRQSRQWPAQVCVLALLDKRATGGSPAVSSAHSYLEPASQRGRAFPAAAHLFCTEQTRLRSSAFI